MKVQNKNQKKWLWVLSAASILLIPNYGFSWEYGSRGSSGLSGYAGLSGTSGRTTTLIADGKTQYLDLSGTDGQDAMPGTDGGDASCPYQPQPSYNLEGADGGDGGAGGSGGNAGSGGNITVFYEDPAQLKNITVISRPGRNGRGAYGGRGGMACHCSIPSWTDRSCYPRSDGYPNCYYTSYYCRDGRDGLSGRNGMNGSDGSLGTATLIQGLTAIPKTTPQLTVPVSSLRNTNDYTLSDLRWDQKSGATSVFGTGSFLSETYYSFSHVASKVARIFWQASRPSSDFENENVYLELQSNDSLKISTDPSAWMDIGTEIVQDQGASFFIKKAFHESESRNLKNLGISGSGRGLTYRIQDLNHLSRVFQSRIRLTLEVKHILHYKERFNAEVPSDLVSVDDDGFSVALGRLPLKENYFKSGAKIRLTFSITRSYKNYSSQVNLSTAEHQLP